MTETTTKKPKSAVRHPFLYDLHYGVGKVKQRKAWAAVIPAKEAVTITLTEEHVKRSIAAHGVGSTSKCSVAVCTYDHEDAFPHNVEGHIDFQYSRAFVVSKVDAQGLPSKCVVYEHNARWVANLNDTEGGQQELLEKIQQNGPITIVLKPKRVRSAPGRSGNGRPATGARDPLKKPKPRGAKLRYAVAYLGALPEHSEIKKEDSNV